jgi:hypothetical protein
VVCQGVEHGARTTDWKVLAGEALFVLKGVHTVVRSGSHPFMGV